MNPHEFNGSAAKAVVKALELLNVERVFGLPGIQNIELFDALADASFQTITPANESAAAFMADAHARVTGKLGVLIVTAGPGLTNALTGIAEAKLDSSPVLVLLASHNNPTGKSFQLHQIPQEAVVAPLLKGFFKPKTAADVAQTVLDAADLAMRCEPGPVAVEMSSELLMTHASFSLPLLQKPVSPVIDGSQLDNAAELLKRSSSVGIYAGAGAMGASAELLALAELLQAPVATTISGRGVIPEDHPLSVGYGFGRSGTAIALKLFCKVRTLLSIGCKFGEVATGSYGFAPPVEHIHIDINRDSIGANYPVSVPIVANAREALSGLLARLSQTTRPVNVTVQTCIRNARARSESAVLSTTPSSDAVAPALLLRMLRQRLRRDAILVTDCGSHQFWALSDFEVYAPRSFITPADFQAMGFSIPAAIAAQLAFPNRQVVSLVGDGGFLMSGFECLNARKLGAKPMIVIFRDGAWGLIQDAQNRLYRRTQFTQIEHPHFERLAQSFGMKHFAIANDGEVSATLDAALACDSACLLDVCVRYDKASRYAQGAARQMFRNLPFRLQAKIATRLARRFLTGAGKGSR